MFGVKGVKEVKEVKDVSLSTTYNTSSSFMPLLFTIPLQYKFKNLLVSSIESRSSANSSSLIYLRSLVFNSLNSPINCFSE